MNKTVMYFKTVLLKIVSDDVVSFNVRSSDAWLLYTGDLVLLGPMKHKYHVIGLTFKKNRCMMSARADKSGISSFPCEAEGNHEVYDIRPLDIKDINDRNILDNSDYLYTAVCKFCGQRIIAKSLEEYA